MTSRNWNREVIETLQAEERREANILCNPRLARLYVERGVCVGLIVVLTYCATGIKTIDHHSRDIFLAGSIFCSMVAVALVSIGLIALAKQRWFPNREEPRKDDTPAIGW
jgi:hypothetical protein